MKLYKFTDPTLSRWTIKVASGTTRFLWNGRGASITSKEYGYMELPEHPRREFEKNNVKFVGFVGTEE